MKLAKTLEEFFLKPTSSKPLAFFRIGVSAVLLLQAFAMRGSLMRFFSPTGLVQRDVLLILSDDSVPKLNSLIDFASSWGISEWVCLTLFGSLYVLGLIALLLGFVTRVSAFLVWILHWTLMNTGYSGAYGADMYAHIFLFYLIWVPSGEHWSLDSFSKGVFKEPSFQAQLGIRVVQLHMCVSYFASGLEKATGVQWWNGEVIWRALNLPGYSPFDWQWLAQMPWLATFVGWSTLLVEVGYCVFIWPGRTRWIWVSAVCSLHLSIAVFLKLPVFGLLMCIPTLTCFGLASPSFYLGRKDPI